MDYTEKEPCASLARVVECYWFLRGDGSQREPRRIVPDGRTEVVLNFAQPLEQWTDGVWVGQPRFFFAGQITGPLQLRPAGRFDIAGIRLRPAGARCLVGQPMPAPGGRMIPLHELIPEFAHGFESAAQVGDGLVSAHLKCLPDARVEKAVAELIATGGNASIPAIAETTGWSTRHL